MKKIISLFQRNYDGDRLVRDELVPGAEWVVAGEGWATEKIDGTCCLVEDGELFKRYDAKKGKRPPDGFIAAQEPDEKTGHWPGWLKVSDGPEDQWYREAWQDRSLLLDHWGVFTNRTCELVGPKVQGNPYGLTRHSLVPHGAVRLNDVPRDFAGIRGWLAARPNVEGIVWWRDLTDQDCDKVKVKARDFGLPWPVKR